MIRYGRVSLIFLTFLFALIVDQIKSFFSLGMIYLVVNRRFGFLKENEKEWLDVELYNEKTELVIPRIKMWILKTLESRIVENISMLVISVYAVFILFVLTLSEALEVDPTLLA